MGRKLLVTLIIAVITTILTALLTFGHASSVLTFAVSAVALAALASLVGEGTEELGSRLGPGATGVLQSALGNLPELFISIFALQAGLVRVVQGALVGSILANSLLVLGLAFFIGGLRHGVQTFDCSTPRVIALMALLSIAAVSIPTFAREFHTPAGGHETELSVIVAIVLLLLFFASLPSVLGGSPLGVTTEAEEPVHARAPLWQAIALLAGAGIAAAFVSDWFVEALQPAIKTLGLSQGFTGLVIVAIAGNAVENVVGIQLAARNDADTAVSVILNSSLQVALVLIPVLVLLSLVISGPQLTLVLAPLLVIALALTAILTAAITVDGESSWIEGLALIGLYIIIAAAFWWG